MHRCLRKGGHAARTVCAGVLLAALVLAATWCAAARPDPNKAWKLYSRFWLAEEADPDALGLFRFEDADVEARMEAAEDEMAGIEGGAGAEDIGKEPQKQGAQVAGGTEVLDSSLFPAVGAVTQPFEWEKEGRHGWALKLGGGRAALRTPSYNELRQYGSFAVDAWVKPKKLGGALFWVPGKSRRRRAFAARLLEEGCIAAFCGEERIGATEAALPADEWRHVAMVVLPAGEKEGRFSHQTVKVPARVQILINGRVAGEFEGKDIRAQLAGVEGSVLVGNDAAGASPYVGLLDEVRVSRRARDYYGWDPHWTDPAAKRELPTGPPFLRDARDTALHAPLDDSCAPVTGAEQFAVSFYPVAKEGEKDGPPQRHAYGVRGGSLLIGSGVQMPVYRFPEGTSPDLGTLEFWFSPYDWDNRKVYVGHLHLPEEVVPLLGVMCTDPAKPEAEHQFISLSMHIMAALDGKPVMDLFPGAWYHVVITWEGGRVRLYVNGKPLGGWLASFKVARPPKGAHMKRLVFGHAHQWRHHPLAYRGVHTLVDEVRVYSRPLTPPEIENAYARWRPDAKLTPLPFANVDLEMNHPLRFVRAAAELLSPKRDEVASIDLHVTGPEGKVLVDEKMPPIVNGRSAVNLKQIDVGYGLHRASLVYRDKAGVEIDRQVIERDRQRPAWLDNNVGMHEGEVLPGWTPMEVEGATVRCWGRGITFGADGWPARIVSRDADILAGPVRVTLASPDGEVALKAVGEGVEVEAARKDLVITRGSAAAGGWRLDTKVSTEFDGMMKVEATISSDKPARIGAFRIEVPLKFARDQFVGFWAGNNWFRGSADYRMLPDREGEVFASNKTGRGHPPGWKGKNSFIPYLALCDDERGFVWFAENDKGWTKNWETPALQVIREGETTTLRLNIVHEPCEITEPMTFVFGLQPTPVRPMIEKRRSLPSIVNFGWVDGFSLQDLKQDKLHSFKIHPEGLDWETAALRSEKHRRDYGRHGGYEGPILYVDRLWAIVPPDAREFRSLVRPGAWRYAEHGQDCYVWYLNEWLRRGLIRGVYIDDAWICHHVSTRLGPAYRLPDGKVQVGFEFFDYRDFMKRLRWAFHDNGVEPLIWVHMTQTHFVPYLAFADVILEGEDRFLNPGAKTDFLRAWGLPRLRYANPEKWGLAVKWMNKIGNDRRPPVPMPHWFFRQRRAYEAGLMLNDLHMERWRDFDAAGCYNDAAQFVGYWDPDRPLSAETPNCFASVYKLPDRAAAVLVNNTKEEVIATFRVDAAKLGLGEVVTVRDADSGNPPAGPDVTTLEKPKADDVETLAKEKDDLAGIMEEIKEDVEKTDEQKAEDWFDHHNCRLEDGLLTLRIRACDYRLLLFTRGSKERR